MANGFSRKRIGRCPAQGERMKLYPLHAEGRRHGQLDFPLFLEGKAPKVTKDVFHGYQLFNSYCYRCHGTDASGQPTWRPICGTLSRPG